MFVNVSCMRVTSDAGICWYSGQVTLKQTHMFYVVMILYLIFTFLWSELSQTCTEKVSWSTSKCSHLCKLHQKLRHVLRKSETWISFRVEKTSDETMCGKTACKCSISYTYSLKGRLEHKNRKLIAVTFIPSLAW